MNKGLVHRKLKSLQKKGLVESTLEYPTRFSAVPFEKIIDSYVTSKKEEVALIEERKSDLLSDWNKIRRTVPDYNLERFSVIEGKKQIFKKISQMISESTSQLFIAFVIQDLFKADQYGIFDKLNINKSKVQFRVLTQFSDQYLNPVKLLTKKIKLIAEFRTMNHSLGLPKFSRFVIRDNDEIVLFLSESNNQPVKKDNPTCLYTNCKSIIQSFSSVFEELWQNSTDTELLINEIEAGINPKITQLIKDPISAMKMYYRILESTNNEVLIVTSSEGLHGLFKIKNKLEDWSRRGISIKVMAPIVTENLEVTEQLLKYCEVKHIPLGYFATTIVDEQHLFQFKQFSLEDKPSSTSDFANVFYTTDIGHIQHTKKLISDIWRKTRTPSTLSLRSISRPTKYNQQSSVDHPIIKKRTFQENVKYHRIGSISEKEVIERINKEKKLGPRESSGEHSICRSFGQRAFALISPPEHLALPKMIVGLFKDDEQSFYKGESYMIIDIFQKTEHGGFFPVAWVTDKPENMEIIREAFAGLPVSNNIQLIDNNRFKIQVKGNTLFAGWTVPIMITPKYTLPPACILFEGYGKIKSGMFTNDTPIGLKFEIWYNSLDAFVTFFLPQFNYVGSGTEGFFDTDSVWLIKS